MAEINEKTENNKAGYSPLEGEGLRGDGTAKWYVVHTYSGYEDKVKDSIEQMVRYRGMDNLILKVEVPKEQRVVVTKSGNKRLRERKLFPGYVVIKMIVNNESWYLVRNTEGVTGFVGHGSNPIPLSNEEIVRMGVENLKIDLDINVGDTVRIVGAQFEGQLGIVEAVNPEKQTVRIKTSAIGRDISMEIDFSKVVKL